MITRRSLSSATGSNVTLHRANRRRESRCGIRGPSARTESAAPRTVSSPSSILRVSLGNEEKNFRSTLPILTSASRYLSAASSTIGVSLDGVNTTHMATAMATTHRPRREAMDIRVILRNFLNPGLIGIKKLAAVKLAAS